MIIGIDASRANRSLRTGTEWYSFYIIQHLAKIDHTNQYILYTDKETAPDLVAAIAPYPNFKVVRLYWPWPYFWTLGRLSWEMLWRRPDVLFVPAHSLPLIHPRRTINTIHDLAFLRAGSLYQKKAISLDSKSSKSLLNFLIRLFTRGRYIASSLDYLSWSTTYSLKHSQQIIAVSEFTKKEIVDIYSKKYQDKVQVVHNGYPSKLYFQKDDAEEQKKVLEKYDLKAPFFLYVGRLEKKKNISALVEAFAIFKELNPQSPMKLVLIGNAGFGYDEIKYIIEEYNLQRSVLMPGWIDELDLPLIFRASLAFVFPTLHEGFGLPVLQAMACGTPALVSNLPVLKEVSGEAALYFDPADKLKMAVLLEKIIEDKKLRQDLIAKGLEQAKKFSWEKSARETLKVLTDK